MHAALRVALCISLTCLASAAGCNLLPVEAPRLEFTYSVSCVLPDTSELPELSLTCDDVVIDLSQPVNLTEVTVAPAARSIVIVAPQVFSDIAVHLDGQPVPVELPAAPGRIARIDPAPLRADLPCFSPPASLQIEIAELSIDVAVRAQADCRLFAVGGQGGLVDPNGMCVSCGMTDLGLVAPGSVVTVYAIQDGQLASARELSVALDGAFRDDLVRRTGPSQLAVVVPPDAVPDPVLVFEIYDDSRSVVLASFCVY